MLLKPKTRLEDGDSTFTQKPLEYVSPDITTLSFLENKIAKDEEKAAEAQADKSYERSIDRLNLYLKAGVLDRMPSEELESLSGDIGISPTVLKAIGSSGDDPELRSGPNGSIWSFERDPDSPGGYKPVQVVAGKATGKGTETLTDAERLQWSQYLRQYTGDDGYVDTGVYRSLAEQIGTLDGPKKRAAFLKEFPAEILLNPQDVSAAPIFGTKPSGLKVSGEADLKTLMNDIGVDLDEG